MIDRLQVLDLLKEGHGNPHIATVVQCRSDTIGKIRKDLIAKGRLPSSFARSRPRPPGPLRDLPPPAEDEEETEEETDELDDFQEINDADGIDEILELQAAPTVAGSVVDDAKARTAAAILAVREKRAELDLARVERELANLNGPDPVSAPVGGDPMVQVLLAQNQALFAHVLKNSATAPAAAAPATSSGLAELLPVLGGLITFVDDLRGGGTDSAPADPLTAMIQMATKQIGARGTSPVVTLPDSVAAPVGPPGGDRQGVATPAPPPFDPEAEGRHRASKWIDALQKEMVLGSDPAAISDLLHPAMGHLPEPLRQSILTHSTTELIAVLRKYLPQAQLDDLVSAVSSSDQHATWLGELLREIRALQQLPQYDEATANANGLE